MVGAGAQRSLAGVSRHCAGQVMLPDPLGAPDEFADAVAAGRLQLRSGRLEQLPLDDKSLDRILSVNTYYFLNDPDRAYREMRRVLRPHGRAVHAVVDTRMLRRVGFNPEEHMLDEPEAMVLRARAAGFASVDVEVPEEDDRIRLVVAEVAGGS